MNKYSRAVISNFFFFIISTLAFLFLTPAAINIMGSEFFGLWSILNSILGFSRIGELGLSVVVKKFASEDSVLPPDLNKIISAGMVLLLPSAFIGALILVIIRGWLSIQLNIPTDTIPEFKNAVLILAITLFPQFLLRIAHGFYLSQLQNTFIRAVELLEHLLIWIGAVLISIVQKNILHIALWIFSVKSISLLILFAVIKMRTGFRFTFEKSVVEKMSRFSVFSFIEYVARLIFQQLDRVLIGIVLGPSAAGVYSVGTSIGLRLSIVTGQITSVLVPYASKKSTENKNRELIKNYHNISRLINVMVMVMGSILMLWMREILTIWISPEYAQSNTRLFILLIFVYQFISLSRSGHQTLVGMGRVRFTAFLYLTTSILMMAGIFWLAPNLGIMGAGIANLSSALLLAFNIYVYILLKRKFEARDVMHNFGWSLITGTIALVIMFSFPSVLIRVSYSLLLIVIAAYLVLTDDFARSQAESVLKRVYKPFK